MSTWQTIILLGMAGCALGCLFGIFKSIERLGEGIFGIRTELTKMNAKVESIEAANKAGPEEPTDKDEPDLADIEAAVSNFEKLKRIDLTKASQDRR